MGIIFRDVPPTRNTEGAIGDICKVKKTGEVFKCIFSCQLSLLSPTTYDWVKLDEEELAETYIPEEVAVEPEVIKEPIIEKVEEVKKPEQNQNKKQGQKHTDYTAYSKKESK